MPKIKEIINRETGARSIHGQYMSLKDYKMIKDIMVKYYEVFEKLK